MDSGQIFVQKGAAFPTLHALLSFLFPNNKGRLEEEDVTAPNKTQRGVVENGHGRSSDLRHSQRCARHKGRTLPKKLLETMPSLWPTQLDVDQDERTGWGEGSGAAKG